MKHNIEELAKMIDHSLLHPTMTDDDFYRECKVALEHNVASVCIKPYAVPLAAELLKGSDVDAGTVIGFPHGNSSMNLKAEEAEDVCVKGAGEVDMVINIGKALGGDWDYVAEEIDLINKTVVDKGAVLKVIFENDYLTDDVIVRLCHICNEIEPAFIKTSTGYGFVKQPNGFYSYKGATEHHLRLMRKEARDSIQIKAAGGVRTLKDLLMVKSIGVTRVGATATVSILKEAM